MHKGFTSKGNPMSLSTFLMLLVTLGLLQASSTQQEAEPRDAAAALGEQDVSFLEVFKSSYCQPFLTTVDVYSEYPDEASSVFKPSCVAVRRCGGCCGDARKFCAPVEMEMVTMKLVKISPGIRKSSMVKMDFLAHKQCECR
ncbi:placenta growth factor [Nothoprocta perdicaria]|uniref:placenta growth factor n=1 Tax=Nothoprocta perdicaria TaxID=30464 RepID=UPI000E1C1761|nr:placenta growth factor [Nothoprocta perdicaria]